MEKKGFLIAIEGAECFGMQRMGERLSKKLCHKGYSSVFGAKPEIDLSGNYFREATQENTLALVDSAIKTLGFADLSGSVDSVNLYHRICWILDDYNLGKKLSATDLQVLSLFERKFHLRSVVGQLASSGCFIVLKGYELSVFAAGFSAGISFEELFALREKVLGRDRVRPDVTILISPSGGRMIDCAINYEIAIARLQNTRNYGFVVRINGSRSEGLVMAEIFHKLSRFIPSLH